MINASRLPKTLWGEAVMHAVWLKNHTVTQRPRQNTLYEMLYKSKLNLMNMPAWGYPIKVYDTSGSKLDAHAQDGFWVRFDPNSGRDSHQVYYPD